MEMSKFLVGLGNLLMGLGALIMLTAFLFILGTCTVFILAPSEIGTETSTTATTVSTITPTTSTTTPVTIWKKVISWEGKSSKDTETFHISSDEWRIRWSTRPGKNGDMYFGIYVHKEKRNFPIDVVANVIGEDSDVSYMRGAGDYYLSIDAGNQFYTIIVEEKIIEKGK